jgi:glycerol-3-phosphate acyltransferase PlsY
MSLPWILCIVGAYALGSIPFGVLIGRARGIDIRQHGSRNIGASNVGRVLGRRLGLLCFALDACKGATPVLVTGAIFGLLGGRPASLDPSVRVIDTVPLCLWQVVAAAAVLGHMFSPFLGFRGGKGVATGLGALAAMWEVLTIPAFGALVVWYGVLRMSRYISLASMCAALSLPVGYAVSVLPRDAFDRPFADSLSQVAQGWPPLVMTAIMAALVLYTHRANIARLRRGEEPQVAEGARRGGTFE